MFPEGTTDDSKEVRLFRAALPKLLYGGEEGEAVDSKGRPVELQKDVVMQPVAIRVKAVDGQKAGPNLSEAENDEIRHLYSNPPAELGFLGKMWKRLQMDTTLEVTVFPPLDPKAYDDAEELLTQAALNVASAVNPGQTEFKKARIPVTAPPAP